MATVVKAEDFQKNGICMAGVRQWFVSHDLNFREFVQNGIPAKKLRRVAGPDGDLHVEQAVEAAKLREASHG